MFIIEPYHHDGVWVFDDTSVGLYREPFVGSTNTIIDYLSSGIPNARNGFRLLFSSEFFQGCATALVRQQYENGGTWYRLLNLGINGWLCPALLLYYPKGAPFKLYVTAQSLQEGVK